MDTEKRTFKVTLADGKEVELSTRVPKNSEMQEAEDQYSVAFNRAIMKGIVPETVLAEHLIKSGIWSEEKDQAIEDQRIRVVELEDSLETEKNETEKTKIAEVLSDEREQLYQMRQQRTQLLSHSAESKAEDAQRDYIVSCVTELASSGIPVWKTYKDFKEEEDGGLIFRATYEYLTMANGLPSDFVDQLPENQVKSNQEDKKEPAKEPEKEPEKEVETKVVAEEKPKDK